MYFVIFCDFFGIFGLFKEGLALAIPSIMLLKSLSMKSHIINGDGPPRGCGEVVGIFGLFKEGLALATPSMGMALLINGDVES